MTIKYDLESQKRAYARWADYYDRVYVKLLSWAQRKTAEAAAACGPDILEIGVGTGLVLPYYPAKCRVIGVDLSEPMLKKAAEKVRERALSQVKLVAAMDACRLGLANNTFNAVAVPFVITLVPDPEGALDEIARVLKPGGEIVISSRLGNESGPFAWFETLIAPLVKKVGWSSTFKLSRIATWGEKRGDFKVVHVEKGWYFTIARLKKAG